MKKSYRKTVFMGIAFILAGAGYAQAKAQPPTDIIPMDAAKKTALAAMPGEVQKAQLEREDGLWVYSFDLKSIADSKKHEVQVDARSGKLISTKAERDDEADEREDEENEAD